MENITCYNTDGTPLTSLTQWDLNQSITLKNITVANTVIVHFFNKGCNESIPVKPTKSGSNYTVNIPNILLQEPRTIFIVVYDYDTNKDIGTSVYSSSLQVKKKPKPGDYEFKENIDIQSVAALRVEINNLISEFRAKRDSIVNSMPSDYTEMIDRLTSVEDQQKDITTFRSNTNSTLTDLSEKTDALKNANYSYLIGDGKLYLTKESYGLIKPFITIPLDELKGALDNAYKVV